MSEPLASVVCPMPTAGVGAPVTAKSDVSCLPLASVTGLPFVSVTGTAESDVVIVVAAVALGAAVLDANVCPDAPHCNCSSLLPQ